MTLAWKIADVCNQFWIIASGFWNSDISFTPAQELRRPNTTPTKSSHWVKKLQHRGFGLHPVHESRHSMREYWPNRGAKSWCSSEPRLISFGWATVTVQKQSQACCVPFRRCPCCVPSLSLSLPSTQNSKRKGWSSSCLQFLFRTIISPCAFSTLWLDTNASRIPKQTWCGILEALIVINNMKVHHPWRIQVEGVIQCRCPWQGMKFVVILKRRNYWLPCCGMLSFPSRWVISSKVASSPDADENVR